MNDGIFKAAGHAINAFGILLNEKAKARPQNTRAAPASNRQRQGVRGNRGFSEYTTRQGCNCIGKRRAPK